MAFALRLVPRHSEMGQPPAPHARTYPYIFYWFTLCREHIRFCLTFHVLGSWTTCLAFIRVLPRVVITAFAGVAPVPQRYDTRAGRHPAHPHAFRDHLPSNHWIYQVGRAGRCLLPPLPAHDLTTPAGFTPHVTNFAPLRTADTRGQRR